MDTEADTSQEDGNRERAEDILELSSFQSFTSSIQTRKEIDTNDNFFKSRASTTEFCRICHDVDSSEPLLAPCRCRGTVSFVHRSCLERWLAESDTARCDLCAFHFQLKRMPKYSVLSSVGVWLRRSSLERKNLLGDVLILLLTSPALLAVNMLIVQNLDAVYLFGEPDRNEPTALGLRQSVQSPQRLVQDVPRFQDDRVLSGYFPTAHLQSFGKILSNILRMGIFSFVVTFDMAFLSWIAVKVQSHFHQWYSWYRRNSHVEIIGIRQAPIGLLEPEES